MTKKTITLLTAFMLTIVVSAQEKKKFSPEKFDAELEAYVTREAALTTQDVEKFFPLFREMHQKQRTAYGRMRKLAKENTSDEQSCAAAVRECDKLNIELKEIEQKYHEKMLKVLPASKVYAAVKAEARFHRQMMKGWQKPKDKPKGKSR